MLFVAGCSTTRFVPEGDYLINKVVIDTDNRGVDRDELKSYVRQRENTRILGFFRFHLWLYNLSPRDKEDHWLKRTGEPPQIYNSGLADQSTEQLRQYLHNKGYYRASIVHTPNLSDSRRKAELNYTITTGEVYRIGDVEYEIPHAGLQEQFIADYKPVTMQYGNRFDLDELDRERDRIVAFFRNRGYYYFSKPMVNLVADTLSQSGWAHLSLNISVPAEASRDSSRILRQYGVNRFVWNLLPGTQSGGDTPILTVDTLEADNNTFLFHEGIHYHPKLFTRLNRMSIPWHYALDKTSDTFNALNRLRQFRFINIYFQEGSQEGDTATLTSFIDLAPLSRQSTSFDLEGTNTSGNFGIAGNLNHMHRNLFKGAEILELKLKGAMERQQAIVSNQSLDFNTREFGLEANLSVPRLIGPGNLSSSLSSTFPRTLFTVAYNFQQRPDYTRTITSVRFGYEWMHQGSFRHNLNIADFSMVNLSRFDPDFLNAIQDLYIKSSFTDHLILASNYSLIYNTQQLRSRSNYSYIRFSLESSGNLLHLAAKLAGARLYTEPDTTGLPPQSYYKLLDSRYAQYVKTDIEFRRGIMIDRFNAVVGRAFFGIGVPYGNFDVLPFEKKYFTGGANGIRAWQVRSLGPGTYQAPPFSYPNQSGDLKIEANLEYRFRLIRFLESTLFLDGGNIWAINENDNRPGARFRLGTFYRQFALGTGTGLRFDFDYFVFRLDVGMKMRDPAQQAHNGWIVGARRLTGDDFNFSFAIGYPF